MPNAQCQVIGLLGGSFNPAHEGHLHISREALKRLGLDAVWWVVTPKNPLKRGDTLADYAGRLAGAKAMAAAERRIAVTDIERRLGTRYTVDTLRALRRAYPRTRFIWLMGADNLSSFHKWKQWDKIFSLVPVAVFDRAPYSHAALRSPAALRFAQQRASRLGLLKRARKLPRWSYAHMRKHPGSATLIRKRLEKAAV